MNVAIQGPQEGALLPDFTLHFRDGGVLYRRELKGRSHAVIYFPPERPLSTGAAMLESLAARMPHWQAVRAVVLVIVPAAADVPASLWLEPVIDRDGALRERFGVGPGGTLFVADRYGEIALRVDGTSATVGAGWALPLGDVAPTLELLEMRCSL